MTDTAPAVDLEPSQVFPANLPHDVALRLLHERVTMLEGQSTAVDAEPLAGAPAPVDRPEPDAYDQADAEEREAFAAWVAAGRPGVIDPRTPDPEPNRPEPDTRLTPDHAPTVRATTPQPFGPVATGDGPESRDADPTPGPEPTTTARRPRRP